MLEKSKIKLEEGKYRRDLLKHELKVEVELSKLEIEEISTIKNPSREVLDYSIGLMEWINNMEKLLCTK